MPLSQAVQDVKLYMPQLGSTHDALLGLIEGRARAAIDAYYKLKMGPGWPGFVEEWPTQSGKLVYGVETSTLQLPPHQVGSVTNVQNSVWNGSIWLITTNVTPATYYEDIETGALVWPGYSWGRNPYTVTAIWGYGPMPDAVYQVLLEVMINIWRGKDRAADAEGNPITFSARLTEDQKQVLSSVIVPWQSKAGTIKVWRGVT